MKAVSSSISVLLDVKGGHLEHSWTQGCFGGKADTTIKGLYFRDWHKADIESYSNVRFRG